MAKRTAAISGKAPSAVVSDLAEGRIVSSAHLVSAKVPEHVLRRLLASMLILIGGKLIVA